jgi:uncharacterized protein YqeY
MGESESNDLPGIGRIGQNFLVPGHGGVEAKLGAGLANSPQANPAHYRPVAKNQHGVQRSIAPEFTHYLPFLPQGVICTTFSCLFSKAYKAVTQRLFHCFPPGKNREEKVRFYLLEQIQSKSLMFFKALWRYKQFECPLRTRYAQDHIRGQQFRYHMREKINTALKEAVKTQDKRRMSTLRLISAAIKDRDIAARTKGQSDGVSDAELLEILSKMIKQRRDAITMYEEAGRLELAAQEQEEIAIIEDFLPRQLAEDEIRNACEAAVTNTGAQSLKDMAASWAH